MKITKTIRDFRRLKQITNVLFKHELGYLLDQLKLKSYLTFHRKLQREKFIKPDSVPKRLRLAMEELSGTFIKLGQLLSLRPDLIPKEYCDEFSKLLDDVQPLHYRRIKEIVEFELKKPLKEIFLSFEETPIASASVGQVHKAMLKNKEIVAVKVQRPNINNVFEADIDILYHLAHLLEKHIPETKDYDPISIVNEFEKYTKKELDYLTEAKNIDTFYKNFVKSKTVKIPKVYWDLTTSKVLTMEFIQGIKISEVKQFQQLKSSKRKVVKNITNAFLKQVLEDGFFHADPHPANVFLLGHNNIALLDFGIIGKINQELKEKIEDVLMGLIKPDRDLLAKSLISLGFVTEEINIEEFKEDLSSNLSDFYDSSVSQINFSHALYNIIDLSRKYKIKLPSNFVLLAKSTATVESLNQSLDPDFNFVDSCMPYVRKIIKKRTSTEYILNTIKDSLSEFREIFRKIPPTTIAALKTIKEGKVKIDIEDSDIRTFALEMDRSSNRITFGLIIAALIVAAALVMLAKLPPYLFGMPSLGIFFLFIAVVLSIFLIISIYKEKGGV